VNFRLPKIYPITDTRVSGISHLEQVEKLAAGGGGTIQLREKYSSPLDFYESATEVIQFAGKIGVRIIINDRVDIALALKADGVHLGQDDMPPGSAREILGLDAVIGFSTHSARQAVAALLLPVDYIAIGPIFQTKTKKNPGDVVGLEGLKKVRDAIGAFPLVAIGGINAENLRSVLNAGADSVAMIGSIGSDHAKIEERMRKLIRLST